VHWLTWRQLWEFTKTWQGASVTALAVLASIYYGPKKVLETFDWYMDRFRDYKVREFLRSNMIPRRLTAHGEMSAHAIARSIIDISAGTKMSAKSVVGSLKRLRRRHHVTPDGENWKAVL
jgi:hypothetical protein